MKLFRIFLVFSLLVNTNSVFAQKPKTGFDIHILYEIKKTRTPFQTALFKTMSDLNNPVCLAVPAALFIAGWIKKKKTLKMDALYVTETIAISQCFSVVIKAVVGRLRPMYYDTTFVPLVIAFNKSFPSGHTTEAFAMAYSVALLKLPWYCILPAFLWAVLIGYARMYLGVHFPTDVIGGILLGMGSAWITFRINKMTEIRRGRKNQAASTSAV